MNRFTAFAAAWLLPAAAAASGRGELFAEKLGVQIGDFLVVVVPLLLVLIPVVGRSLKKRHDEVQASIDEAKATFESARARLESAEEHIRGINAEMESIRKSFRDMGETEKNSLEMEAMKAAEKIREEADMRINQAALTARAELTAEVVGRALEMVESKFGQGLPRPVSEEAVRRVTEGIN